MTDGSVDRSVEMYDMSQPDFVYPNHAKKPKPRILTEQEKHAGWQRSVAV